MQEIINELCTCCLISSLSEKAHTISWGGFLRATLTNLGFSFGFSGLFLALEDFGPLGFTTFGAET